MRTHLSALPGVTDLVRELVGDQLLEPRHPREVAGERVARALAALDGITTV